MSEILTLSLNEPLPIEIYGEEYNLQILTLGDYLKNDIEKQLNDARAKAQCGLIEEYRRAAANIIAKYSNIPQEVLFKLQPIQLDWILLLIQEVSPDKIIDDIRQKSK